MLRVIEDATHFGRRKVDLSRTIALEELVYDTRIFEVEFRPRANEQTPLASRGEPPTKSGAHETLMTGDKDLTNFTHVV